MQLNLFDVNDLQQAIEKKQAIYERLKHYLVDDYYNEFMNCRTVVFKDIRDNLNGLTNYNEYYSALVRELKKVVPTVIFNTFKAEIDYNCLIKHNDYEYGYFCESLLTYSPLFCLVQIPDDFFA